MLYFTVLLEQYPTKMTDSQNKRANWSSTKWHTDEEYRVGVVSSTFDVAYDPDPAYTRAIMVYCTRTAFRLILMPCINDLVMNLLNILLY